MTLIKSLQKDREKISQIGRRAIAAARAAHAPVYYIDRSVGEGIVKLMPDGSILLLDPQRAAETILQTIEPDRS